jgi:quercetin dioxygenase-like cupin family protein
MNPIFFQTTDWDAIPVTEKKGESGVARYRTMQFEQFRVRVVEYSAGYTANHWCKAGHVVYCLEGEMTSELIDGRTFNLKAGMSYVVSDDIMPHRSSTATGVKLMIVDGNFLSNARPKTVNPWKM